MWGRFWLHGGGIRHPLLNHLVGTYQEPGRKFDPERLRRFEVEGRQLDFCSLFNRQIGWFLALVFLDFPGRLYDFAGSIIRDDRIFLSRRSRSK